MKRKAAEAVDRLARIDFPAGVDRITVPPFQESQVPVDLPRRRISRRTVFIATAVAAVVAAGGVAAVEWILPRRVRGELPPLLRFSPAARQDPAELLAGLAAKAARRPDPPGTGEVLYTIMTDWHFATAADTAGNFLWVEGIEEDHERWVGANGQGRDLRVQRPPYDDPTQNLEVPVKSTAPVRGDLASWLIREGRDLTTAQWFGKADDWRGILGHPKAVSAYLRALSAKPGIKVEGMTSDRQDRPAIAFSTPIANPGGQFPEQRGYLLFDPASGELLSYEVVGLTADTSAIGGHVDTPATYSYTIWLNTAYVPDTRTRPS